MKIRTVSNISRSTDIGRILVKYGFNALVDRDGIPGTGLLEKFHTPEDPGRSLEQRIRLALQDLGPTYIKMGQVMSMRPDILPTSLVEELQMLQDDVEPVDFTEIKKVVEENLGEPLDHIFTIFEETPLAAASLAQVHRAVFRTGGPVLAVKIQRPGIREIIETDLDIIAGLAERLHHHFENLRVYDLPELVRTGRRTLLRELDFTREARYMTIARRNMEEVDNVYIPKVYEKFCTEKVLIMENMEGTRLREMDMGVLENAEYLARQGFRAGIKQIFEDGFFHADPHPGNVLLTDDRTLCLLDWGMVGRLTQTDRHDLINLIHCVVDRDSKNLTDVVLHMAIKEKEEAVDRRNLEIDLMEILDAHTAIPVEEVNVGQFLMDITSVMKVYRLHLPAELAIMIKSLVTAEGMARQIYPALNVIEELEPHIRRISRNRMTPMNVWTSFRNMMSQLITFQNQLPKHIAEIVDKIHHGELNIRFYHEHLENIQGTLEKASNRLTFAIIIAAMIVGSSMIITTGVEPLLFGYPALGVVGYLISGVIGLVLVLNIISTSLDTKAFLFGHPFLAIAGYVTAAALAIWLMYTIIFEFQ